jgi:hypothetical protein
MTMEGHRFFRPVSISAISPKPFHGEKDESSKKQMAGQEPGHRLFVCWSIADQSSGSTFTIEAP